MPCQNAELFLYADIAAVMGIGEMNLGDGTISRFTSRIQILAQGCDAKNSTAIGQESSIIKSGSGGKPRCPLCGSRLQALDL
jgi:hypothetical protein